MEEEINFKKSTVESGFYNWSILSYKSYTKVKLESIINCVNFDFQLFEYVAMKEGGFTFST